MGSQMKMLTKPSVGLFVNPIHWNDVRLAINFFVLALVVSTLGCSSRDAKLEQVLTQKLTEFRRSDAKVLDLRTVIGDSWEKVCIQGSYVDQAHFEKYVGRKVTGFRSPADENIFVLWVFYRDGTYRWARVHRGEVMDSSPNKGTPCTSIDNPFILAADYGGTRKYYFLDKGR